MLFPDYKEFSRLAQQASLIPVAKTVAADLRTPVSAFLSLAAEEPNAFLLESVEGGEKIARYSFIATGPSLIYLAVQGKAATIKPPYPPEEFKTTDPLTDLEKLLPKRRPKAAHCCWHTRKPKPLLISVLFLSRGLLLLSIRAKD